MKVLIVSDATSVHTQRWVSSLKERGIDAVLYSIVPYTGDFYTQREITCHYFNLFNYKRETKGKLYPIKRHLEAIKDLKRVIRDEKPDILHSHYLTSYSFIAALSGFHPFIASVWGSDIYIYPKKSPIHAQMVRFTLGKADKVLSTSHIMAKEASRYTHKQFEITPFGVDTEKFYRRSPLPEEKFIIGCVKTLSGNYGQQYIIRAFNEVVKNNPQLDCTLELVGNGPDREKLETLTKELGLQGKVNFRGFVENSRLPEIYDTFSVVCHMSQSESFGVSALEAMAHQCPVIASDTDGFKEVIEDGTTGIIVPRGDYVKAAQAIQSLIDNPTKMEEMGKAGRERVCRLYDWNENVDTMISIYKDLL